MSPELRKRMEAEAYKLADVVSKLPLKDNPLWKLHTFECHIKGAQWMHSELWPLIEDLKSVVIECAALEWQVVSNSTGLKYGGPTELAIKARDLLEQFEKGE